MAWDKWVNLACEVVATGFVCAAAVIAWRTLHAWRDQMLGCSRFELARSMLYNAHLLARGIQSYRAVWSHEDRTPEGLGRSINEPAAELDRYFIEARFLFPSEMLEDELRELNACVGELLRAINRYGRQKTKPEERQDPKRLQECEAIIWPPESGDDDPFAKRVEKAVESLTRKLQPFVAVR